MSSPAWNYRISTGTSASIVETEAFEMDEQEEPDAPRGSGLLSSAMRASERARFSPLGGGVINSERWRRPVAVE
jgi:hypothetical protein